MANYNKRGRACIINVSDTQKVEAFFQKWGVFAERLPDNKYISVSKAIVELKDTGVVTLIEPQFIQFTDLFEE